MCVCLFLFTGEVQQEIDREKSEWKEKARERKVLFLAQLFTATTCYNNQTKCLVKILSHSLSCRLSKFIVVFFCHKRVKGLSAVYK